MPSSLILNVCHILSHFIPKPLSLVSPNSKFFYSSDLLPCPQISNLYFSRFPLSPKPLNRYSSDHSLPLLKSYTMQDFLPKAEFTWTFTNAVQFFVLFIRYQLLHKHLTLPHYPIVLFVFFANNSNVTYAMEIINCLFGHSLTQ